MVVGDPAELVFLRLTTKADFRFDDEWWKIVPIAYGRQPARAAYEHFIHLSSSVWQSQPGYHQYRKAMLASYIGLCRSVGRRECRQYLMRLWAGWKEEDAIDYSRAVINEEKGRPAGLETVRAEADATTNQVLVLARAGKQAPTRAKIAAALKGSMAQLADVILVPEIPRS